MADEPAGLPLADFIGALRAELRTAALAKDPQLQFNVGPVNVEFTLMTHHEGGGKAGIRFGLSRLALRRAWPTSRRRR
jgi:hypothetical protein